MVNCPNTVSSYPVSFHTWHQTEQKYSSESVDAHLKNVEKALFPDAGFSGYILRIQDCFSKKCSYQKQCTDIHNHGEFLNEEFRYVQNDIILNCCKTFSSKVTVREPSRIRIISYSTCQ